MRCELSGGHTRLLSRLGMVVLLASPAAAYAQESAGEVPDAITRDVQAAADALASAVAEFEGPQQSRSIVALDEVVARLEALGVRTLPPRGRDLLVQAYEYRGRAYFNIGLTEKASESFRLLVQVKPDHTLSKERVSPKVVELFNNVKRALVGYLAVSSKPAGAHVTLIGPGTRVDLGLTDFFPIEVLAGDYTIEVARPGYQTETRSVSIAARGTQALDFELVRVLASLFVITEPAGVEVWVDGELRATTAGNLALEHHVAAQAAGIDPLRASVRTELANLSLASHVVEYRKRCYETVRGTIDTSQAQDYDAAPVRLEESLAGLRLSSDPPGARIYLNGEARGVTPAQIDGICSGKVRVEVKHAAGKFIKDLVLGKDEAVSLDCPIRPTLAFLGVEAAAAGGLRHLADAEERILENLSRLESLNFIAAPREAVDRMLDQEKTTRAALFTGADADLVRKVTERLAAALEVQGFLLAILPDEPLQRTARLLLIAAGNTTAESLDVAFAENASYGPALSRLDFRFPSRRPWTGLVTIDTLTHKGVPVLRVVPGSPAAQGGVRPGDVLLSVDGQPIERTADWLAAVASRKPGERVTVQLQGAAGGAPRSAELVLGETAREIPFYDPQIAYNKAMMDQRSIVQGYPGSEQAAYAWLNLALCAIHFSDFAGAHDYLQKAKAELPTRAGLARGTALYYLGLVLDKLGYRRQAVEAYAAAGEDGQATLIDNDGPAVSPLASRRGRP